MQIDQISNNLVRVCSENPSGLRRKYLGLSGLAPKYSYSLPLPTYRILWKIIGTAEDWGETQICRPLVILIFFFC